MTPNNNPNVTALGLRQFIAPELKKGKKILIAARRALRCFVVASRRECGVTNPVPGRLSS